MGPEYHILSNAPDRQGDGSGTNTGAGDGHLKGRKDDSARTAQGKPVFHGGPAFSYIICPLEQPGFNAHPFQGKGGGQFRQLDLHL
jgi:hypothetical protein